MADPASNLSRMKALTGAYYGVGEDAADDAAEAEANAFNMDSSYFKVDEYVTDLLSSTPYLQLLDLDEELRKTIVQLDSSMQLLVYENYPKFIGATDTMQNMKEKLIKMESQVSGLESKMDAIANATRRMNERNSSKREEVARLDRLGGLVNKLSTLFELPKKLRSVSDIKETLELVQLYKSAAPYLEKHTNVPSFAKIDRDARNATEEIAARFKQRLIMQDVAGLSVDEFDALVTVLLDLDEPVAPLAPLYFRWHRDTIFKNAVPKEEAVKESFETCTFLLKTTMFEPLNHVLTTSELLFPEHSCSEEIADQKLSLAKEVVRAIIDKLRARFDAEPASFLVNDSDAGGSGGGGGAGGGQQGEQDEEEDAVDRIIRALTIATKEFSSWDRALPTQSLSRTLALGDRAQELAERVVRKQVNAIMSELKQRTETHLKKLADIDQGGDSKVLLDQVALAITTDANRARSHFARLLKRASQIVSTQDMAASFDELFKFQLRDWTEYLSDTLKYVPSTYSSSVLLAQALLAKLLSTKTKELGVVDQKTAARLLSQSGDDALKAFCTLHGVEAARLMAFDASQPPMDRRPTKVGDGVVVLLNHVVTLARLVKAAGVPTRGRSAVAAAASSSSTSTASTGVGAAPQGGSQYTRPQPGGGAGASGRASAVGAAGTTGLGSQILKMFSEKLIVFDKVELDGTSILAAAMRVALKTWFEHIREEVLNRYEFQQIQLDANFVRNFVPLMAGDYAASVNKLIAEVVASARERCTDPSTMDAVALDTLCNERKDDVRLRG